MGAERISVPALDDTSESDAFDSSLDDTTDASSFCSIPLLLLLFSTIASHFFLPVALNAKFINNAVPYSNTPIRQGSISRIRLAATWRQNVGGEPFHSITPERIIILCARRDNENFCSAPNAC